MTPILPAEPVRGSIVHDNTGERWWRGEQGWSRVKAHPNAQLPGVLSWRELNNQHGPVTLSLTPRDLGDHVMVTTDPARNHGSPSITRTMVPIWSPVGLLLAGDTAETVRSEFDLTDGETAMLVAFTADLRGLLAEHAQEQQGGVDAAGDDKPLPIPDGSYLIGIHSGDNLYHAVDRSTYLTAVDYYGDIHPNLIYAPAECHREVSVARSWGEFRRGIERVDRASGRLCPECAWTVALHHGTEDAELDAITPSGPELGAMERLGMPDPLVAVRLCERILDDRASEREYDADHPRWAQWLGHVTCHCPVALLDEECCEGGCGHQDDESLDGCYAASTTVACHECSLQAGPWAGEWEGQYEVTAPAPCTALVAVAKHYDDMATREMTR